MNKSFGRMGKQLSLNMGHNPVDFTKTAVDGNGNRNYVNVSPTTSEKAAMNISSASWSKKNTMPAAQATPG